MQSKKTLMHIDVSGFASNAKVELLLQRILAEFFRKKILKKSLLHTVVLSVTGVDTQKMKQINYEVRGKRTATDVLSFEEKGSVMPLGVRFLGDLVICLPVLKTQAKEYKHRFEDELKVLLVHGLLHLCGYDHEKSKASLKKMQRLETDILRILKVNSGLIQRTSL